MNENEQPGGRLKKYLHWPIIVFVLSLVMCVFVLSVNLKAGLVAVGFTLVICMIAIVLFFYNRPKVNKELIDFAMGFSPILRELLESFESPYALISTNGNFLWANRQFSKAAGKISSQSVFDLFPDITEQTLPESGSREIQLTAFDRDYRMVMDKIDLRKFYHQKSAYEFNFDERYVIALSMFDETESNQYLTRLNNEKLVLGFVYIDNYDEALDKVEDVQRSIMTALADRKINQYFTGCDGLVKKLEKDKYFVVMMNKSLDMLKEKRFSILDEIKSKNISQETHFTVSIGIGLNASTYAANAELARAAIELALGRGGDQAVIKDGEQITYFGGKSASVGSNNRVKARIKAQALKESLTNCDKMFVMGHQITDVDSFGAAIGICRAGRTIGKKVHVVIEDPTISIRPLMEKFMTGNEHDQHLFMTHQEALDSVTRHSAVVVVDTNKPSYTECPELLTKTNMIIVLDHHRQGSEVIKNATLSYIEPYASSACEMVAEVLQYFDDGVRIRSIEADCMYSGIMIDTNNFMAKTSVRTFEAAAFLRRSGADITRIRKMFRSSIQDYRARAETIWKAQLYLKEHAIGVCPSEGLTSPTIVCAQAANEMLNIEGIKASYALTDYNGAVHISARAIDEVNVQLIMERLGGGGHMNIAGAQLKDATIEYAIELLKNTILEMTNDGDI